jgi:two-component system LytT family response regulator
MRVLIVDDEPMARRGLRGLLSREHDVEIAGEAKNGAEAVRMIRELRPDVVLLDVQMPELNGFDVLQTVGTDAVPVVIFVTAYDEYALRAFDVQALDYLLKPFDDDRFRTVLERTRKQLRQSRHSDLAGRLESLLRNYDQPAAATPQYLTRILVKNNDATVVVNTVDIDWIEAADYYVKLHVGRVVHFATETLNQLERALDPAAFVRVHRSAIVNTARVREIRLDYRNHHVIVLTTDAVIPLSRSRRETVEARLAGK